MVALLMTFSVNIIILLLASSSTSLPHYQQQAMAQEMETSSPSSSNYTTGSQSIEGSFLQYENSTYGIKISYPSTWTIAHVNNTNGSRYTAIVAFDSPDENARITLWTDFFPRNETLDTYLAETIQNYRQNPNFPNFTVISSDTKNTIFAGIPGYEILYTYTNNDTMYLQKEIGAILGDKAYAVTYNSILSQYSVNEMALNPMIESLVINVPQLNQTSMSSRVNNATTSPGSTLYIPEI
jgi:hypothetical protein